MKIGFIHYFWNESSSGVNYVAKRNQKALSELYPNTEIVMISHASNPILFPNKENRQIDMTKRFSEELLDKTKDLNAVLIENPFRQLNEFSSAPEEYKKFTNQFNGGMVYRHHDLDKGLENIVPESKNVKHVTLINKTKKELMENYQVNAEILKNSVIPENFYRIDEKQDQKLRKRLEELGMVLAGENLIGIPNRIVKRKNIGESIMIAKGFQELTGEKYRILVTTSIRESETKNKSEIEHEDSLIDFAKRHGVRATIGGISKVIDNEGYNVGNLYHISKFGLSTSMKEGFGFMYVESQIADTPLIGRRAEDPYPDFIENGLDLSHLYGDEILFADEDSEVRLNALEKILSNKRLLHKTIDKMQLQERLEYAKKVLPQNKLAVEMNYPYGPIGKQLAGHLQLGAYKNIKVA